MIINIIGFSILGAILIWICYWLYWHKLIRWFGRKHIAEKERLIKERNILYAECGKLKNQIEVYETTIKNIESIILRNQYNFLRTTSKNEKVIIGCYSLMISELCMIELYNPLISPALVCHVNIACDSENIHIEDLITKIPYRRAGYARVLMEFVIQYAKDNHCNRITGELSRVDKDEFDWLIPFYKSIGFEITMSGKYDGNMIMSRPEIG